MTALERPRRGRRQSSGRKTQQPARLSRIKTTKEHNATRKTYFFNGIGQLLTGLRLCAIPLISKVVYFAAGPLAGT
jgi:hypothetical protein